MYHGHPPSADGSEMGQPGARGWLRSMNLRHRQHAPRALACQWPSVGQIGKAQAPEPAGRKAQGEMPTGKSTAPSAPSRFPLRGWARPRVSRRPPARAGPLGPVRLCPSHASAQARARREHHNGAHRPSPHRPSIDLGSRRPLPRGPPGRPLEASGTHSRLPHRPVFKVQASWQVVLRRQLLPRQLLVGVL